MGHRTLKRVPHDFQGPLNTVWEGYINPYPRPLECNLCHSSGYNTATYQISEDFYSFKDQRHAWNNKITKDEVQALIDQDRLMHFTHTWTRGEGWVRRKDNYIPTAGEVNAAQDKDAFMGSHDAINRHILIEARAKRLGVFGKCPICNGEGTVPHPNEAVRKLYEEWTEYEPPIGDGYQLWETCTEGSPISPVFASAELLAEWCADNATIFASEKMSYDKWLQMFTGEKDLEVGSLLIAGGNYVGSIANAPL